MSAAPGMIVAVVGSANLDIVVSAERIARPGETVFGRAYSEAAGGKGLNQAVAAARVARCSLIAAVGADPAGETLRRYLAWRDVRVDHLVRANVPTGRAFITVAADAENSITVVPLANDHLDADTAVTALEQLGPGLVVAQCEIPMATVVAVKGWAERAGARFVLNPSPITALPAHVVAAADPIIVNAGEARAILEIPEGREPDPGELAAALAEIARSVVLTLGRRGAVVGEHSAVTRIPGEQVAARDTTGAGDEFAGILAGRLAAGDALPEAAAAANKAAAHLVTLPRDQR
jgi:ribokinase